MDLNIFNSSKSKLQSSRDCLDPGCTQNTEDLEYQWLTLDLEPGLDQNEKKKHVSKDLEIPILSKKIENMNPNLSKMSTSQILTAPVPSVPVQSPPVPPPVQSPPVPPPDQSPPVPPSQSQTPSPPLSNYVERLESCEAQLKRVTKQLDTLSYKMEELLSTCQRIDTRIVEHNEREVNLQIRKYSIQKHKGVGPGGSSTPLHFVPSTTNGKKHFGLFADLLK